MPIAVDDGIPLQPTTPVDMHFDWVAPNNPLAIPPVFQEKRCWCWAACASMVLNYYHAPTPQCSIVAGKANDTNVCTTPDAFSDVSCLAKDVAQQWANFNFDPIDARVGKVSDPKFLRPVDIQDQIAKGQPIEVGIRWWRGGSHAVLIKGWSDGGDHTVVWINDPLEQTMLGPGIHGGEGPLRYAELKQGYGWGYWIHTWSELKPKEPTP